LGVSRQGELKNTIKIFLQNKHAKNFSQNFDKKFDVSFSSTFFVLSRFRVFLSDGSSETPQKTFCKKNRVKIQNRLFLEFVYHVFGRFSMRGVQKHDKKYRKNKSDPSPFSYSDPPTHHGGHRFCFAGPLPSGGASVAYFFLNSSSLGVLRKHSSTAVR
jgi:hypothetical protein